MKESGPGSGREKAGCSIGFDLSAVKGIDPGPPLIRFGGTNPLAVESHTAFVDPGKTTDDTCAVTISGNVNINTPPKPTKLK